MTDDLSWANPEAKAALEAATELCARQDMEEGHFEVAESCYQDFMKKLSAWQKTQEPEQLYLVQVDGMFQRCLIPLSEVRRVTFENERWEAIYPWSSDGSIFGPRITGTELEELLNGD